MWYVPVSPWVSIFCLQNLIPLPWFDLPIVRPLPRSWPKTSLFWMTYRCPYISTLVYHVASLFFPFQQFQHMRYTWDCYVNIPLVLIHCQFQQCHLICLFLAEEILSLFFQEVLFKRLGVSGVWLKSVHNPLPLSWEDCWLSVNAFSAITWS